MAIRRKRGSSWDELPAAKLYLDEVEEIVAVLSGSPMPVDSEVSVKYHVRGLECDTFEDLEKLGGRVRDLRIEVDRRDCYLPSCVHIKPHAFLSLSSQKEEGYWERYGRIKSIFESNSIAWKNAVNSAMNSPTIYVIVGLLVVVAQWLLSHFLVPAVWRSREEVIYLLMMISLPAIMWFYLGNFRGSVVVLSYSHTKGLRGWAREHGTQVLLIVLGIVLKYLADGLWQYFHRN